VVDDDVNAEVSQYLQLVHIPFAHQRNEEMFFFVLPGTGYRHDLTETPSNNLIQDSGFRRFVAISAYSRPTTCEIQETPTFVRYYGRVWIHL
jgi:hypothetical protein